MSSFRKFLFRTGQGRSTVRGEFVRLTDAWAEVLKRRRTAGGYPAPVRALLGEMAAAGVLLAGNIKFDGALVLQMMGEGPVRLAVAEVGADLGLRATAKVVGDVGDTMGFADLMAAQAPARCVITLDPRERGPGQQPYQGVVPLRDAEGQPVASVAQALQQYMRQSEQLDTWLMLAADEEVAAGLLIQRLPAEGGVAPQEVDADEQAEHYNRIVHLSASLTREELLHLDPEKVLHRLYWEESLAPLEQRRPHFACTCSRERVGRMLRGLGRDESDSLIAERGLVEVSCDFCGADYRFDAVDIGELFTPERDQPPGSSRLQ